MIPLHFFTATCALFAAWCSALVMLLDANAVVGFTLAAVNAGAALLTGYGTYRMSRKERTNAKMAESPGDPGSGV